MAAAGWKTLTSRVLIGFAVLVGLAGLLLVVAMALVQSGWAERRIETLASERLGRNVDVEGLRFLAAWPPQVEIARVRIPNPDWAKERFLLDASGLRASVAPGPLLRGRIVATAAVDKAAAGLEKDGERNTWTLQAKAEKPQPGQEEGEKPGGGAANRFQLRSASIGEARAVYRDHREDTEVTLQASGDLGREGRPFEAFVDGRLRGEPLEAEASAPAVPLAGDQPVELKFQLDIAKTRTAGNVALKAGADVLQSIRGHVEASGPSIAAWKRVAGGDLPESAPYNVVADVGHEKGILSVENLQVRLGKSDLQGSASVDTTRERPFVKASLQSNQFDLEETGLKREVKEELEEKFLIPRVPWPTDNFNLLDADVELRIKKVRNAQPVPFDSLEVRAVMDNASLKVDPLNVAIANGRISGRVALDASESPERGSVHMEIRGLALSRLFPKVQSKEAALGRINGRIELSGRGETPAALLGSADGRILFAAERGTASGLLVEVLGLDAAEAIMLLGKQKKPLPLRCAVADLKIKNGIATASPFVIDASDSVLSIEGSLHLGKETIDLKARAEPRDTSPFTLRTPVNITGTFLDPKVRPQAGPLASRGAAAIALGVINPLLALIPFADPGGDPEPGCQPQKQ